MNEVEEYTWSLDARAITFEEFGVFVAISDDRTTLFFCPMTIDGKPEMEGSHFNWSEVTAPDEDFLAAANNVFGTDFKLSTFSGR
jgi:hypothetical protein